MDAGLYRKLCRRCRSRAARLGGRDRRRAAGGPAESAFATLVGLELRPRRLREAASFWRAVTEAVGGSSRDELWAHPDLLPTSDDLDEPMDFVARQGLDDELAALTADDAATRTDPADPAAPADPADPADPDGKG